MSIESSEKESVQINDSFTNQTRERDCPVLRVSEVVWACTENPANINQVVFLAQYFPLIFLLQAVLERLSCASRGIKVTLPEQCGSRTPASLRIQTPETPTNSTHGHRHIEHFIREKSNEITGPELHKTSASLFDPDGGTRMG